MMENRHLEELETDGWYFKIGDVYSNPFQATHFKITKIVLEENSVSEDAMIHGYRVHPENHEQIVADPEVFEGDEFHRAWHFNESWGLETI